MSSSHLIRIRGARQHNLKNLDLDLRTGEMTVVTGPSGSGKSSLVFDTLYAEGQRRYVETFSAYARQFLDRMDRPQVDRVDGVPPAIAIDQTNPVRSSRSTVGTMTELNDHLKLLYARAAELFDRKTARPVRHDTPETIHADLLARTAEHDPRLAITFPVELPDSVTDEEVEQWLSASGYTRVQAQREVASPTGPRKVLDVVADRFRLHQVEKARAVEAIEASLKRGGGRVNVYVLAQAPEGDGAVAREPEVWRFSTGLHDPESDLRYAEPQAALFSFNSAYGACETCRGFGRVIGVDLGLVIPDARKTLRGGAIKPMQTPAWKECQDDLMRYAAKAGIRRDVPWSELTPAEQDWVINGSPDWTGSWQSQWYGVRRFFGYLESKAYKMHIRVLLSKYRSYTPCETCGGARLKTESLLWRLGSKENADAVLAPADRFMPHGVDWSRAQLEALSGLTVHDLMLLPIDRIRRFFDTLTLPSALLDDALKLLLAEVRTRLKYLCDVGLGYLTLDRQSRTLSGGEVQRINLTTALGTSLTKTLFVLDEPSIGLHPRDLNRIVEAMQRLRDAGNTLVVVEHDPSVMLAADRLIDMGPGPGERGGTIVYDGTPADVRGAATLTGEYLGGRRQVAHASHWARRPVDAQTPRIVLEGAREHNLRDVTVEIPLQRLVCVTGVSGSGKSTLIQDVLYPAIARQLGRPTESPGAYRALSGAEQIGDVVFVDQSPIGKTTRSNPASYVGAFDEIRKLFAKAPLALQRGYGAGTFSFNSGDGRCPTCGGSGFEHVEMQFLSDVYLRCPDCDGRRYRAEVLEVRIARDGRALNIADVLDLTVSEAAAFFAGDADVLRVLQPIVDVGLEYVKLGQPVPTLSGGEAQRLKLAGFLAESAAAGNGRRVVTQEARVARSRLFMFDEPTTGLHFDDIAKLMQAFGKLLAAGHSLIVIEHNLDVIRAADWLIDLGPEGGDGGGLVLCAGTPDDVKACAGSHTGAALRDYERAMDASAAERADEGVPLQAALNAARARRAIEGEDVVRIVNAREHNLKALDVDIPHGKFNVITGVSGSGKSTLAFDILFHEGQRRYLESLNAYARSIVQPAGRPEVDAVYGIPPTVAIEQRLSRGGRKSTVATTSEVWHFLRLLYVKLGLQHCVHDGTPVASQSVESIAAQLLREHRGQHVGLLAPLVVNRKGLYTDLAKWAKARGHTHLRVDGEFVPVDPWPKLDRFREHTIELPVADLVVSPDDEAELRQRLDETLEIGKGVMHLLVPLDDLHHAIANGHSTARVGDVKVLSVKRACPVCGTSYPELDPRLFSYNSKHGWCTTCVGTGLALTREQRAAYDDTVFAEDGRGREQTLPSDEQEPEGVGEEPCADCGGTRLNPTARAVTFDGHPIVEVAQWTVSDTRRWIDGLRLVGRDAQIARDIVSEIGSRLAFLEEVGLGYLSLDRAAPSLSGGEAQRIRLAAQLGSNLQGVCYVLDEPTIGLHPRDNQILLNALRQLGDKGNTLVVVEHDEDTIRRADHIIDIGPGAGKRGGTLVAQGKVADLAAQSSSLTGRLLAQPMVHPLQPRRRVVAPGRRNAEAVPGHWLTVHRANLHNLRDVTVGIPLARLVAVTGVSGSGKSTLARDVLMTNLLDAVGRSVLSSPAVRRARKSAAQDAPAANRRASVLARSAPRPALNVAHVWQGCESIDGWQHIDRVLEVDQTPIGKTPRSCPATYIGVWDAIRRLFADTLEARARGYTASRFSFNTGDGRCPACEGQGVRTIGMSFLPDVKVPCDVCHGQRFNPETLAVTWRGRNIGEVLTMEIDEAVEFFASITTIAHPLQLMKDVGLGYLTLGQPSPTLSGGEAQRIKLVTELSKVRDDITRRGQKAPHTLYVLDEPTVGLHMADVAKLIRVLHRLVDGGHSVVVIEHDLDVIAEADWIIDLGPEGGVGGGTIVAAAPPEALVEVAASHTGRALAPVLAREHGQGQRHDESREVERADEAGGD
ncbi:excinuclease ABC subunit UvrA [Burkholderia multivorans]|uniref:UvrABC system protein A n=5 Tax=Burkholderia cepacia complex TaxID=87882 RepID=A0A0H3KZ72_BURM1|nr:MULTISPECIES: excinuclease ABC subunit UvrA [Burkholderia cepacia complex]ABX19211.1 excinuclease ABC, A subunit [Burkholderia multivorans ATCC 17616]AIO71464.1 excinuclease ABC subunit A [Burkholderia multivorans]AOK69840.1 excinuclease ABC subunit A [Burkholderia multivorans]AYY99196.1 excinuclease ABC subunit A [Burkholderia multivorans]KVV23975.1 excinuclease ABC subunit A [Burkholderia multivorans]